MLGAVIDVIITWAETEILIEKTKWIVRVLKVSHSVRLQAYIRQWKSNTANTRVAYKNIAKLAWLLKFILVMTVSDWPRLSCWLITRLAYQGDLRSSQSSKPQKLHQPPLERTTWSLLWYPFRCVEWKATSVTATEFYGAVSCQPEQSSCCGKFGCLSFIKHTLEQYFLLVVWKNLRFYEPQFRRISLNISLSDSVLEIALETKALQAKKMTHSMCRSFNLEFWFALI